MAVGAYIFINTRAGGASTALVGMKKLAEVKQCHLVTGIYDVIAYLEAADVTTIGTLILTKIHTMEGVDRTVTCVTVQG